MNLGVWALGSLAGGAAVYFLTDSVRQVREYAALSRTQQREIDYAAEAESKPIKERVRLALVRAGYRGDLTLPLLAMLTLYLAVAVGLKLVGVEGILAVAVAVPGSAAAVWTATKVAAGRRRRAFARQLAEMLTLLATQIEAGVGVLTALRMVTPALQDPLRGEMMGVLTQMAAGRDAVEALKALSEKYPSRALRMTIAAFEIDRDQGGQIAPALRQASSILRRDFELAAEASSELAEQKQNFWGVFFIIIGICVLLIRSGGTTSEAYLNPIGLTLLGIGAGNAAIGLWRGLRFFDRAKGDI